GGVGALLRAESGDGVVEGLLRYVGARGAAEVARPVGPAGQGVVEEGVVVVEELELGARGLAGLGVGAHPGCRVPGVPGHRAEHGSPDPRLQRMEPRGDDREAGRPYLAGLRARRGPFGAARIEGGAVPARHLTDG